MHPTLTFDLVQADHRDRIEAARQTRDAARRAATRASAEPRGRPPERRSRPRPRLLLVATTAVGALR